MKKYVVTYVLFLLFCSVSCWANVAPEFRHPCQGRCCIAGANPGTYSMCQNARGTCSSPCRGECHGVTIECGTKYWTVEGCKLRGYEMADNTCSEITYPTECDPIAAGLGNPCDTPDCLQRFKNSGCVTVPLPQ